MLWDYMCIVCDVVRFYSLVGINVCGYNYLVVVVLIVRYFIVVVWGGEVFV